jgi:dihydroxyacetone kinase DhaKLM complex PTS-EIIA-like component DhaM
MQVRFYHDLVLVLVPFHSKQNQMLVAAVLLAAAVAHTAEEAPVVEGAVAVAVHTVVGQEAVDAALGAVHTLEEGANLVEGGAVVVAPVPSRQ